MNNSVYEIEKMLEDEIDLITEMEKRLSRKRELLVMGEIDLLAENDEKIADCENFLEKLMNKRTEYGKKLGYEKPTLTEIINKTMLIDKELAHRLISKKLRINNTIEKINKTNSINDELIKHGISLVQSSIRLIAKTVNPEVTTYNNHGKTNSRRNNVSSIVREA